MLLISAALRFLTRFMASSASIWGTCRNISWSVYYGLQIDWGASNEVRLTRNTSSVWVMINETTDWIWAATECRSSAVNCKIGASHYCQHQTRWETVRHREVWEGTCLGQSRWGANTAPRLSAVILFSLERLVTRCRRLNSFLHMMKLGDGSSWISRFITLILCLVSSIPANKSQTSNHYRLLYQIYNRWIRIWIPSV